MNNVIVIGAGPAGLMAAATAARAGAQVTLMERNEKLALKLRITGKGRCNITNNTTALEQLIANVPMNGRFLFSAFSRWMPADTIELLEQLGVSCKVERGGRVFPASDNAHDVADALVKYARDSGVKFVHERVTSLEQLRITNCELRIIVATGGMSYPKTGSTGDGYALAQQAGHTIVTPKPSLVPLECHEGFCSRLSGLALRNTGLQVWDNHHCRSIYEDQGELLFTHFGVSGPMALSASSHMREMQPDRYQLWLDLKPGLSHEKLDTRILRDFAEQPNKNFINALNALLPKSLVPVIVQHSGIAPGTKVNQVTREQRGVLVNLLKQFTLTVTAFRPLDEAIITSGGVNVTEIHPGTMQSKLNPNLYFAGEVIDVDAYTGGYNLQIAFATGVLAGENVIRNS
ncbi:MAG: NAD(P)/FAD-dependent oxidoreductase [Oscillospiraceae bacterium]|nr:NAD(P)/FAD-dependent oxidoreductase [Oscillospiraceae bacterium]